MYLCSQMVEINEKLDERYRQQKDGVFDEDEEWRLRQVAQSYALCENSIAVLSNLRTDQSHIYFGKVGEVLGFANGGSYQKVDSVWEEEIYARIHPDDWRVRCLQELTFFRMVSASHTKETFAWHLENTMRMRDYEGRYHSVLHRIFYFTGRSKPGICYSLCLYNLAAKDISGAWLVNTLTGERKKLDVENSPLLTERERLVLQLIREGKSSKLIAERLDISKHTVDRHRQNIIAKLQVSNTTEACHKAKQLGLIE